MADKKDRHALSDFVRAYQVSADRWIIEDPDGNYKGQITETFDRDSGESSGFSVEVTRNGDEPYDLCEHADTLKKATNKVKAFFAPPEPEPEPEPAPEDGGDAGGED